MKPHQNFKKNNNMQKVIIREINGKLFAYIDKITPEIIGDKGSILATFDVSEIYLHIE